MRRFLVVGCGGSGGATQRFTMDQLRADLDLRTLPKGWQFVHVDVPTAPDDGPKPLRSVPDQGGRYVSVVSTASSYRDVAALVDQKLRTSTSPTSIATWRPDPNDVRFTVANGAGQFRAIGRMLTLGRAEQVLTALRDAWSALQDPAVHGEMRELSDRHPNLGTVDPNRDPIVLVVASLAGGSGAAMALDVCRLLTLVGISPGSIGLFTYLPDVFRALAQQHRVGVEANAAASLAELIAAQSGAAGDTDSDLYVGLGLQRPTKEAPFARVFPIGRTIGTSGAVLGEGKPEDIYRATGRALAALMGSDTASETFIAYDLTNQGALGVRRARFGWGIDTDRLVWGAFGYAGLSLGRDRYAEYAAQRLARGAADLLLEGHLSPSDPRPGSEQVRSLAESQWARWCERVGLPTPGLLGHRWLAEVALGENQRVAMAGQIRSSVLNALAGSGPGGGDIQAYLGGLRNQVAQSSNELVRQVGVQAYAWTYTWHLQLRTALENAVSAAITEHGLPYAAALLRATSRQIETIVSEIQPRIVAVNPADLPADVAADIAAQKGKLASEAHVVDRMLAGYQRTLADAILNESGRLVVEVLRALATEVVTPLAKALDDATTELEAARRGSPADAGVAMLATDDYRLWPAETDARVAARFDEAENEVLLISAGDFADQFDGHVRETADHSAYETARFLVIRQIVAGQWATTAGERPPGPALRTSSEWRPAAMQSDPSSGRSLPRSRAAYTLNLLPAQLLARARQFVRRPDEPFQRFAGVSLRAYVEDRDITESERDARRATLLNRFKETLALARPLVGVNATTVSQVHEAGRFQYSYKFSSIPLESSPSAEEMLRALADDPSVTDDTTPRLKQALSTLDVSRVDVFGSYQNYSPVVFKSILEPIAAQWSSVGARATVDFWRMRRSRPLSAALPCGELERQAFVRGWLVGLMVGGIRDANPGVEVYDVIEKEWCLFPTRLLTPLHPPSVEPAEPLARLLESMVLALVACHDDPALTPLRPYQALRRIWDTGEDMPTPRSAHLADGAELLLRWIEDGHTVSGLPPLSFAAAGIETAEQRATAVIERMQGLADRMQRQYLSGPPDRREPGIPPLTTDLAPDLRDAAVEIAAVVADNRSRPASTGGLGSGF